MSEKSSPNTRIKKKETISPANGISSSAALRKQAQTALLSNPLGHDGPDCMSPEAIKNLVHDLSVHQI